jgi:hypothetical protein
VTKIKKEYVVSVPTELLVAPIPEVISEEPEEVEEEITTQPFIMTNTVLSVNAHGLDEEVIMPSQDLKVSNIGGGEINAYATLSNIVELGYGEDLRKYDDLVAIMEDGVGWETGDAGSDFWELSKSSGIKDGDVVTVDPVFDYENYSGTAGYLCDLILHDDNTENEKVRVRLIATSDYSSNLVTSVVSASSQHLKYRIKQGESLNSDSVIFSCDRDVAVIELQSIEDPSWISIDPETGITQNTVVTFNFSGVENLDIGVHNNLVILGSTDVYSDYAVASNTAFSIMVSVVVH